MSSIAYDIRQTSETDLQHERAVRGAQVVQRFASTLCLREIRTRVVPTGVAPAWSTSNTITFVENDLADLGTVNGVLSFKGLSFHEIAHILFTPRSGSDIVRWVKSAGVHSAFNALEDQRIETLMVGRFGDPVVPWLTAVVVQHILSNPQALPGAFALVRGRKYLPVQLRRLARDMYASQADVAELSSIIDEYRTLIFPTDTERAKALIARYAELVRNLPEQPEGGCGKKPVDSYEPTDKSRPVKPRAQQKARENAEERDEQDEADTEPFDFGDPADDEPETDESAEPEGTDGDDEDADGDDSDSDGSGDSDEDDFEDDDDFDFGDPADDIDDFDGSEDDGEGINTNPGTPTDQPGDDADGDSDSDSDSDGSGDSDGAQGQGAGSGSNDNLPDAIEDMLNDILNDVIERLDDTLRKDVRSISDDPELVSNNSRTPGIADSVTATVDPVVASASRAFGVELERLKAKFDPDWERQTKSGKLNASRFLRGYEIDEVFDKWQTGREDVVDIEAVILLDVSGSMQGDRILHASNAMWGIKRALDKVGASTTVVTFSSSARVLYKGTEDAGVNVRMPATWGSTEPLDALKYAQRVLAESGRAIKVLFTITDGEWGGDASESEAVIKTLRTSGVLTSLAFIDETPGAVVNAHESEIVSHITHARDLLFLGRQLVKLATARQLSR